MKDKLKQWEAETQYLVESFADYYFGEDRELWWVGDEVGGVVFINDHFFNLNDIVEFIRHGYSRTKMFEYYEYSMKCYEAKAIPINIQTYVSTRNTKRK